jgi:hypothetical protein
MNETGLAPQAKLAALQPHANGIFQRKCTCGIHTMSENECSECLKKKATLQRKQITDATPPKVQRSNRQLGEVFENTPAKVGHAILGKGRPLEPTLRKDMELRFRQDFSSVRVHTDGNVAQFTLRQQAHALTIGNDILFGYNMYAPETSQGRWLLAHELTHVVQQGHSNKIAQAYDMSIDNHHDEILEQEADRCASQVLRGESITVAHKIAQVTPQAFPMCRSILDAREEEVVAEADVQRELATRLSSVGAVEREFPVPSGSFNPYRTENSRRPNTITPQIVGGNAGRGAADLALLRGQELEIAEVKRGNWTLITDAEMQVENYVKKASDNLPFIKERWNQRRGGNVTITSIRAMPTTRFNIPSPLRIGSIPTTTSWCRDGVIAFKAIGAQDPKIFVCGSMLQSPDQFIDSLVSKAEIVVDQFIDGQLVARIDNAIQSITVRKALERMLADPALNQVLQKKLGSITVLAKLLGNKDRLLDELDKLLKGQGDRVVRLAIKEMKARVVAEVRRAVKQQIKQSLQTILNALCAKAAQITADEILRELELQMRNMVAQAIPLAVVAVVSAVVAEMLTAVGEELLNFLKYLGIAVGIVIAAIALWEIAAAIAAGAALAEIGAAITAFFTQLARTLLPIVFA